MTPDSIILLSADNRLDALLNALQCARTRFQADPRVFVDGMLAPSYGAYTAAWEALHAELMSQLPKG